MTFDSLRRQRALRRYRFMFKASLAEVAVSVLTIVVGVFVAFGTSRTEMIGWGVILLAISVIGAYKILNSTVRLLEHEVGDGGWHRITD